MAKRKRTTSAVSRVTDAASTRPQPTRDGWQNVLTGVGQIGRDKTLTGVDFFPELIAQETAEQVWRGDAVAARIIEKIPDEMMREPPEVQVNNDKEVTEELAEIIKGHDLYGHLHTALKYARAYGGGGVLLGVNEGINPKGKTLSAQEAYRASLEKPINEDRILSIDFLNVFTPRELVPVTYYSDPLLPNYGMIETYRITPIYAPPGGVLGRLPIVHESRILRVPGNETTRRAMLTNVQPGWPDSILVRVLRTISQFQQSWGGVSILLSDFAQSTLKLKGLAELAAQQGKTNDLTQRAQAIEMARSIARATIIDADEEYKRETTNVAGLSDLLERLAERLALDAEMPVSMLFGQAPGGLQSTGDTNERWFYDQIAAKQRKQLQPQIEKYVHLVFISKNQSPTGGKAPDDWKVVFPALWQATEKERAETRYTQAQADAIYLDRLVVTPEEMSKSRFGGPAWSAETHLDDEARGEMGEILDPETGERPVDPVQEAQVAALKAKAGGEQPTPGEDPDPKDPKEEPK